VDGAGVLSLSEVYGEVYAIGVYAVEVLLEDVRFFL